MIALPFLGPVEGDARYPIGDLVGHRLQLSKSTGLMACVIP